MDYEKIFRRTGQQLYQAPWLIGLGGLVVVWSEMVDFGIQWWLDRQGWDSWAFAQQDELAIAEAIERNTPLIVEQLPTFFSWFIAYLLFLWLWGTVLDAGGIQAVGRQLEGEKVTAWGAVRAGWGLMRRFIAVDTILFFPLFLIWLGLLLLPSLGMIWLGVQAGDRVITGEVIGLVLGSALLSVCCLLCIMVPVGIGTLLVRIIALRAVVIDGLGVWACLRHVRVVLSQRWVDWLVIGLILAGLRWGIRVGLGLVVDPAVGWGLNMGGWGLGVSGLFLLVSVGVKAVWHAFSLTIWTVVYAEIGRQ
ncbi:MAG TPA: hypothetical protein VLL52_01535 [Anaerolineae bacterium]|nr:hypothetical protein [Anaerolineae bacterium]